MKKSVIISFCFLAVGLVVLFISLSMINFDFTKLSTVKLTEKAYEINGEFTSLVIDCKNADFRLLPSKNGKNHVVFVDSEDTEHTVNVLNDVLTVKSHKHKNKKWYDNVHIWTGNETAKMYLEAGMYKYAKIRLSAGDINLSSKYIFGELGIENISGDVKISSGIEDNLHVITTSGDVELTDIECREIIIESVSGDVQLSGVNAELIKIKTTSGDVQLNSCDGEEITLDTVSGDIEAELLSGKQFVASTTSGDVKIPRSTIGGTCTANTVSGDIEIELM